ncbi:hypothetical protein C0Q70_02146 [Pomacea canaliculata]|uniref:Uncharacterized protein n=1 Tax=Pomacea canaliculata TaxID=400727 RepID=A0A2T7Q1G4_POMCA|nr:hypothetical protein C0Q70_02146 [Pomacea canaliculata]
MCHRRSISLRSQWNLLNYPYRCDNKTTTDTVFNSNLFTTFRTNNDGHQTSDHCILTAMKSLVLILVLAAASMSAHVPEERALLATNSLTLVPPLLTTLMSVLGPIAAALLNVVTSLVGSLLGSLLGTALAVVQGLLALVLGIVSKLVSCVTAAINIPVGNIVESVLGAVTSAVSPVISNLTVQFLTRWDDRDIP